MDNSDTIGILQQLERGEISANEAEARLNAPPKIEREYVPRSDEMDVPHWVRRLWVYPLAAGILLVGLGAWVITATVNANILWFVLGLPIVLLGSFVIAVAASARSGHWMYIDIRDGGRHRHNVHFGIPFPFGLIRFGLGIAQWFAPYSHTRFRMDRNNTSFDWSDADALIDALERELAANRGVTVDVDDDDSRVQVYIV
jgi:hypothetical protein